MVLCLVIMLPITHPTISVLECAIVLLWMNAVRGTGYTWTDEMETSLAWVRLSRHRQPWFRMATLLVFSSLPGLDAKMREIKHTCTERVSFVSTISQFLTACLEPSLLTYPVMFKDCKKELMLTVERPVLFVQTISSCTMDRPVLRGSVGMIYPCYYHYKYQPLSF